jgi:hypothetical protein
LRRSSRRKSWLSWVCINCKPAINSCVLEASPSRSGLVVADTIGHQGASTPLLIEVNRGSFRIIFRRILGSRRDCWPRSQGDRLVAVDRCSDCRDQVEPVGGRPPLSVRVGTDPGATGSHSESVGVGEVDRISPATPARRADRVGDRPVGVRPVGPRLKPLPLFDSGSLAPGYCFRG